MSLAPTPWAFSAFNRSVILLLFATSDFYCHVGLVEDTDVDTGNVRCRRNFALSAHRDRAEHWLFIIGIHGEAPERGKDHQDEPELRTEGDVHGWNSTRVCCRIGDESHQAGGSSRPRNRGWRSGCVVPRRPCVRRSRFLTRLHHSGRSAVFRHLPLLVLSLQTARPRDLSRDQRDVGARSAFHACTEAMGLAEPPREVQLAVVRQRAGPMVEVLDRWLKTWPFRPVAERPGSRAPWCWLSRFWCGQTG